MLRAVNPSQAIRRAKCVVHSRKYRSNFHEDAVAINRDRTIGRESQPMTGLPTALPTLFGFYDPYDR